MSFKQNYGQHQGSGTGSPQMSLNGQALAAKNTAKLNSPKSCSMKMHS